MLFESDAVDSLCLSMSCLSRLMISSGLDTAVGEEGPLEQAEEEDTLQPETCNVHLLMRRDHHWNRLKRKTQCCLKLLRAIPLKIRMGGGHGEGIVF